MNSYLLDTHILLWWLSDSPKLTKKIHTLIEDPDNDIFVSSVSAWEIAIKKSLNKLDAPENLKEALEKSGFELLPMTIDHALYVEHLPKIHQDPFDHLLISQCIIEDLIFISMDKQIQEYNITYFT